MLIHRDLQRPDCFVSNPKTFLVYVSDRVDEVSPLLNPRQHDTASGEHFPQITNFQVWKMFIKRNKDEKMSFYFDVMLW